MELENAEYGSDLPTAQQALEQHRQVHREIMDYRSKIEKCIEAQKTLTSEEQKIYSQYLSKLEVAYSLLMVSGITPIAIFVCSSR